MTQPAADKPSALELAWGLHEGGRRGPKPGLTLAEIVAAAIAVADAEGIEAVSMQRVASELGFTPMALYRYVPSKDDLVMLMVDAAGGEALSAAVAEDADWRSGLERWARAQMAIFERHPWITGLPISGPPMLPNQVAWMEIALSHLASCPLSMSERVAVMTLLASYVRSHHRLFAEMGEAAEQEGRSLKESEQRYMQVLRQIVDPVRFPHVAAAFAEGSAQPGLDDVRAEFEFGLGRILDGVAQLIGERSGTG